MVDAELTARFEELRPTLLRLAYRLLGSLSDAEDIVQEAWLRLSRTAHPSEVRDLRSFMTTTVTRLSYDLLGSARVRRESYVGPWLPEPLVQELDPTERLTLDESVSMALMLVLERLTPAERTAFVLHDTFGMPFEEIAAIVGRTPAAVRQLASRARRQVHAARPRAPVSAQQHVEIVGAFATACADGDLERLMSLLDPDVVWRSDGGGIVDASRRPQHGALHVAKAMVALARTQAPTGRLAIVNGAPGGVIINADGTTTVISMTIDGGRITAIDSIRNPDKLRHVEPTAQPRVRT